MSKAKIKVDWNIKPKSNADFKRALSHFSAYLEDRGYRSSTIELYLGNVGRYLKFAQNEHPSKEALDKFKKSLHAWKLSRSTWNQYAYAIKAYHRMSGGEIDFRRIEPNNIIPYYFTAAEINKIFSVVNNIKHLAMLQTVFYGCLRASECCALNDEDLSLDGLSIRVNGGKGGKDGIVYISNECASVLKDYLEIRPQLLIEGEQPLFYTDHCRRWNRFELAHMFHLYKKRAGIEKRGGIHIFARQSSATLMIANGCSINVVQQLLRHSDIRTTLRYCIIEDSTAKKMHEKYLVI